MRGIVHSVDWRPPGSDATLVAQMLQRQVEFIPIRGSSELNRTSNHGRLRS
jgi:hypothetical protein